ncbi:MAG TPA: hypothetical protein VG502_06545 [Flexivirga sp.]|uniref:hypothetical protein n=1 Tax=Flexivirga sp. TaxID=1962927 RepID=UPI002CC76A14|nr:hypothetical protein [Flexivirga sp.]HWC21942.1 hypothetical protein [Flexivirga sp.]
MIGRSGRVGGRSVGAIVGLLCGLVALGPSLAPGYLLHYDLVFVPRLALSDRTMGVDGSVPRAVPNDFVVALLSHLAPGWVVEKALLLAVFVLVGAGVGALMRSRLGAASAALVAAWNPYVAERLAIGHWGYLLGYACVPFLVAGAAAVRRDEPRARTRLACWLLLSAATGSTGAVLGLIVVLSVLAMRSGNQTSTRRRVGEFGWALGIFVLASATWWFAYLFLAPSQGTSRVGVEAFMAKADTPWGVLGSLVTGGGIWNEGVWFSERQSLVVSGLALLVVVAAVALAVRERVWRAGAGLSGLTVAGVVGLVLAAASAVPGGRQLMTVVVTDLPGGGLLRDAQKFVGLWVLLVAVLAGRLVERVHAAGVASGAQRVAALTIAGVVACWPVVTLTGLAWGAGGQWRAVDYPASYTGMAERIDASPAGGVAVFPWALYRQYSFDHDVVVLDPWQRLLDREVLVNDDLPLLGGTVVPGESPDAHRITTALHSGSGLVSALRDGGVRYVLVQTDQPMTGDIRQVTSRSPVASAADLRLYDLGTAGVRAPASSGPGRYTGWVLAGFAVVVVAANSARDRKRGIEGDIEGDAEQAP